MFHVPENYRRTSGKMKSTAAMGNNGLFEIPLEFGTAVCIASNGKGWEHVSVHMVLENGDQATPVWDEMCQVKDLFWDAQDVVVQFHPAETEYVNVHANVLHLWRPTKYRITTPPTELV